MEENVKLVDLKERRYWSWEEIFSVPSGEEHRVAIGALFYEVEGENNTS